MRPFVLSTGASILLLGTAWAQSTGGGASMQLPVGQTFKNFEVPIYQDGKLKATINAIEAKGITVNRAETSDLKIQIYENDSSTVTTTVTSPKADLYVSEQKMRTKNTVQIERADMEASAQSCDFDLKTKQYLLRTNVRVVLKNFDAALTSKSGEPARARATSGTAAPVVTTPIFGPISPSQPHGAGSMLESPGGYSDTNSAPTSPTPAKP